MNFKTGIHKQIIAALLDAKEPVTTVKLAEEFDLSERTVRNYLKDIGEELEANGIALIKKPGVGVYLDIDEEKRAELLRSIQNENPMVEEYSPEARREYILGILLKNRGTYTIQLLSEELYCSKSTIINDLVYVEEWLEDRGLCLRRRQNQGLWVEGNEDDFRRAMADLFFEKKDKTSSEGLCESEFENLDDRLDLTNYKKIRQMFPRIDLLKIQQIILQAEDRLKYSFTDQAFVNLIVHIAIAIERIKNNRSISIEKNFEDIIENNESEYRIAEWIVKRLSEEFKINIPREEIIYITLHILGAKIQEQVNLEDCDALLNSQEDAYQEMAKEMIALVSHILKVDLTKDKLLQLALALHLRPTIVKLKYGLKLRNPMLERIKNEYTSIFGAVWACSSIFEKNMGVTINEDEIGYITLHFAVAMERVSSKIRAAVICSSGVGTSQMVAARLSKKVEELDIVAILPSKKLDAKIIGQTDLIITTVPIQKPGINSVYISTLVDEMDILNIKKAIARIKASSNGQAEITETTSEDYEDIIDGELCFIDKERKDFTEIINYYGSIMEKRGFVKEGFSRNILEREIKSSTYIGRGISIPHSTEEFVIKPKVCIILLKNPISWRNHEIRLIIILALKFKDVAATRTFFKKFYNVLDNAEAINRVLSAACTREIVEILKNGGSQNG